MSKFLSHLSLALCLVALPGCYERHEWRQKLTVVVETPTGEVSGSGIVQVNATYWGQLPATGTEVEYDIAGEATVVEVAPQKNIFVLLPGAHGHFATYAKDRFRGMSRQEWLREIPRQTVPAIIPFETAPILVTLADITDPNTLVEVNPANVASIFGSGYRIIEMTIEITDEPVDIGRVDEALSPHFFVRWDELYEQARANGIDDPFFRTLAGDISRGAFVRSKE